MKAQNGNWGELFEWDKNEEFDIPLELEATDGDGALFLDEAHEALNRLQHHTNKRGRLMKQPKRAESWQ